MPNTLTLALEQPLGGHYWWVAGIIGPHVGAIIGGWVYFLSIDHSSLKLVPTHDDHEKTELRAVVADDKDADAVAKEVA